MIKFDNFRTPLSGGRKGRPRTLRCQHCNLAFSIAARLADHLRAHEEKSEPVPVEEMKMPLPEEWYLENLKIPSQSSDLEFLVDGLYLDNNGKLICLSGDQRCFETSKLDEMKNHRKHHHPLLEHRFSADTWEKLLPERFWTASVRLNNNLMNNNAEATRDRETELDFRRMSEVDIKKKTQENIKKAEVTRKMMIAELIALAQ